MKNFITILLLFLTLTVFSNESITIIYEDKETYPYQLEDGQNINLEKGGTLIELLLLVEKKLDIKINFVRAPWDRCFYDLETGKADGLFYASYKEERLKYGVYPLKDNALDPDKSIETISYILYKLKSSNLKWDGKSFSNLTGKIGAPKGYSIVGDLQKMGVDVEESPGTLTDLKKLTAKRLAGVAALEEPADFFLSKDPKISRLVEKISPPLV